MLRFRFRPLLALCAVAATLALVVSDADARPRSSFGSRGSQTHSGAAVDGDLADRASRSSAP